MSISKYTNNNQCVRITRLDLSRFLVITFFLSAVSACVAPSPNPSLVTLKVAPQVCAHATEPGVPPAGLPYRPNDVSFIQGGTIEDGDFSFDLWLDCDSQLKANTPQSAIEGLGVYGGYYYSGPNVYGSTQDYWGFEPNVAPSTGSLGPLYKTKGGYRSGIDVSQETVFDHIKNDTPFRFQVKVESPVGVYGAVLQFKLDSTQEGCVPTEITVEPLNK